MRTGEGPSVISKILIASPSAQPSGAKIVGDLGVIPIPDVISIGVVLDESRVFWGDCVIGPVEEGLDPRPELGHGDVEEVVLKRIVPALQGRSLTSFRRLAEEMDWLTETVTLTIETPPSGQESERSRKISRRAFFTGQLTPAARAPATEQITVERPIHPRVRYAVGQALLTAVAAARGETPAEVIAAEYGLSLSPDPVPIHVENVEDAGLSGRYAAKGIGSLAVRFPGADAAAELGANGVNLKAEARKLAAALTGKGEDSESLAIQLGVTGGLGHLFNANVGRILGVLVGLREIASKHRLRIADPMIMDSRELQIDKMRRLKEYLQFRKIPLRLVASAWIDSLEAVESFAEAGAAQMLHLDMARLGSLPQCVQAIQTCQRQGIGVILGGGPAETDHSTRLLCHLALASRPELIAAPARLGAGSVQIVASEMARTRAWLHSPGGVSATDELPVAAEESRPEP